MKTILLILAGWFIVSILVSLVLGWFLRKCDPVERVRRITGAD